MNRVLQRLVALSEKYPIPFKFYEGAAMSLTYVMSVSYRRVERLTPAKCYYGGDISPGELLPRIQRYLDIDVCIVDIERQNMLLFSIREPVPWFTKSSNSSKPISIQGPCCLSNGDVLLRLVLGCGPLREL